MRTKEVEAEALLDTMDCISRGYVLYRYLKV